MARNHRRTNRQIAAEATRWGGGVAAGALATGEALQQMATGEWLNGPDTAATAALGFAAMAAKVVLGRLAERRDPEAIARAERLAAWEADVDAEVARIRADQDAHRR